MCVSVCACVRAHTLTGLLDHTQACLTYRHEWMNEAYCRFFFFISTHNIYSDIILERCLLNAKEVFCLDVSSQRLDGKVSVGTTRALLSVTVNQGFYWLKGDAHSISSLSWPCQHLISGFWGICRTIFFDLLLLATSRLQNRKSLFPDAKPNNEMECLCSCKMPNHTCVLCLVSSHWLQKRRQKSCMQFSLSFS